MRESSEPCHSQRFGLLCAVDPVPGASDAGGRDGVGPNGAAWLNGSEVPKSAAVFSGDMLQTRPDSTASIQSNGSSVMVLADSLVKFEGPAVELEHGAVRVTTSRGLAARAK